MKLAVRKFTHKDRSRHVLCIEYFEESGRLASVHNVCRLEPSEIGLSDSRFSRFRITPFDQCVTVCLAELDHEKIIAWINQNTTGGWSMLPVEQWTTCLEYSFEDAAEAAMFAMVWR